jgi:large subunit ribosomal protein L4
MSPASSSATAKPRGGSSGGRSSSGGSSSGGKARAAKAKAGAPVLPPEIFDAKVNVPLIHQVVVAQEAAARQGTHATKTRGEVRGGGRKPYRQKGTGRARQGSTRAPQWAGGGVVHGPHPRSYDQKTPKKMKAAALRGALSDRARHGRVHVVDSLIGGALPRTKDAMAALTAVTGAAATHVLVVITRADELTRLSLRNARSVHVLESGQLNTRDVLVSDHVVFTQEALDAFVARVSGAAPAVAAPAPTAPKDGNGGATAESAPEPEDSSPASQEPATDASASDESASDASASDEPAGEEPASEKPKPKPRASRAKAKQEDDAQ